MATTKTEGAEVRAAFDGPALDHDKLLGHIEARIKEEHERSSDGSESAAKVSAFIEETGMNSQAYSWMKTILKKLPKKDGQSKAMDVIRSIEAALPMIKAHVSGQSTAEMFPDAPAPAPEAEKPKAAKKTNVEKFTPKAKSSDPEIQGQADDFEAQLAAVQPE